MKCSTTHFYFPACDVVFHYSAEADFSVVFNTIFNMWCQQKKTEILFDLQGCILMIIIIIKKCGRLGKADWGKKISYDVGTTKLLNHTPEWHRYFLFNNKVSHTMSRDYYNTSSQQQAFSIYCTKHHAYQPWPWDLHLRLCATLLSSAELLCLCVWLLAPPSPRWITPPPEWWLTRRWSALILMEKLSAHYPMVTHTVMCTNNEPKPV